ncbi:MAG: glycosyltransferase family 2 protein [Bacteroidota bacterium]
MSEIAQSYPLVTVNILSFNRKDDLRVTLTKVYEQDYKNIEVIVVDNASSDGTVEMVKSEFPSVLLIEMKKNVGIAGWNEGFKASSGQYILVLDDNAFPANNAIHLGIQEIRSSAFQPVGCIALNIIDPRTKDPWISRWQSSTQDKTITYPVFVGCAVLFDMTRINKHSIMPIHYFLYQHELPVSAEIHRLGLRIVFNPKIMAYHTFTDSIEPNTFRDRLVLQNNLYFILEEIPYWISILYALQVIIFYLLRSMRRGWFRVYLSTVKHVLFTYGKKAPVSFEYFLTLRKLYLFNQPNVSKLSYRLRRHQDYNP